MTRVALIGLGMVADMHATAVRATQGRVELCGVMARNADKTRAFADKFGDLRAYDSLETLDLDRPDFVILATPPDARLTYVERLAKAGIPILMEKPIERDTAQAKRVVEIYETAGLTLGVVLQHRMRPAAQDLMRVVQTGTLGDIATVELRIPWWRDQSYYDAPGRGTIARDGGGVLITQAIHQIDLMIQLCGPVAHVVGLTKTSPLHQMEAEDFAGAVLNFACGAIGTLVASVTHYPGGSEMLVLNGTRGTAVLSADNLVLQQHGKEPQSFGQGDADTGGGADPMAFSHAWHQSVIEDFADAIQNDRQPAITGRSALSAHALIDAIHASSKSGRITPVETTHV
ncbi:MAG: Gfo/Idh/MocA family oxidoreductase [Paracoccaceae bacterium]